MHISASKKPNVKENDHRGTHAFTGLTFAPSVIIFS